MADLTIKAVIEILLQGKGGDEAAKVLRTVEEEAKRARVGLEGAAGASAQLGASLKDDVGSEAADDLAATGEAAKVASEGLDEAAEGGERLGEGLKEPAAQLPKVRDALPPVGTEAKAVKGALEQLNAALRAHGQDSAENVALIRDWTKAQQDAGGATKRQAIPAIAEYVAITKSVPASLSAVKLATELSTQANIPFAASAKAVAAVLRGDMVAAAAALGIATHESTGELRDQGAVLAELGSNYGDLTSRVREAAEQLPAVSAELPPTATAARTVTEAFTLLDDALDRLGQGTQANRDLVHGFTEDLAKAGGPIQARTVPAVAELLKVTGQVPGALAGVKLATQLAAEANIPWQQSLAGVTLLLRQDLTETQRLMGAAEQFGISIRTATGAMREEAEVARELERVFGSFTQRAKDARGAVDAFAAGTRNAAGGAEQATKATGGLSGALTQLARSALGFVGIYQLFNFLKNSVQTFAEVERGLNATRFAMRALGIDADRELPKVTAALQEIRRNGGPLLTETIPVYQKFIGITENVSAALAATKLASDLSERGLKDVGTTAEALAQAMEGRAGPALLSLGIALERNADGSVNNVKSLQKLIDNYSGLGSKLNDTQDEYEKLHGKQEEVKEQIGQQLAPAVGLVYQGFLNLILGLRQFGTIVGKVVGHAIESFRQLGTVVGVVYAALLDPVETARNIGKFKENLLDAIATAHEAIKKSAASNALTTPLENLSKKSAEQLISDARSAHNVRMADLGEQYAAEVDAAAGKHEDLERAERAYIARYTAIQEQFRREIADIEKKGPASDDDAKEKAALAARILQRAAERDAEATRERASKARQAEEQAAEELLQVQIAAAKEGTAERQRLELELIEHRREARKTEARETIQDQQALASTLLAIDATADQERDNLTKRDAERRRQAEESAAQDVLRAQIAAAADGSQLRFDLEMDLLDRIEAERLRRAKETEDDVTAIQLAAALERMARLQQFEEQQIERRLKQIEGVRSAEIDEERAILEGRLAVAKEGTKRFFEVQQELIDLESEEQKRSIIAEEQHELSRIDAAESFALAQIELFKQIEIARLHSEGKHEEAAEVEARAERQKEKVREESAESRAAVAAKTAAQIAAVEKRQETASAQNTKAAQEAKVGAYQSSAQLILGSLSQIFGQSKAFAVADAVISTYEGATRALADHAWPYSGIVAGFVTAAGLARVAQILSTNPGSSGGGGATDRTGESSRRAEGGAIARASDGDSGLLSGPGTSTSDSIATLRKSDGSEVRLSDEEFVVRARVVRRPGVLSFLHALNREELPPVEMAEGGAVAEARPRRGLRAALGRMDRQPAQPGEPTELAQPTTKRPAAPTAAAPRKTTATTATTVARKMADGGQVAEATPLRPRGLARLLAPLRGERRSDDTASATAARPTDTPERARKLADGGSVADAPTPARGLDRLLRGLRGDDGGREDAQPPTASARTPARRLADGGSVSDSAPPARTFERFLRNVRREQGQLDAPPTDARTQAPGRAAPPVTPQKPALVAVAPPRKLAGGGPVTEAAAPGRISRFARLLRRGEQAAAGTDSTTAAPGRSTATAPLRDARPTAAAAAQSTTAKPRALAEGGTVAPRRGLAAFVQRFRRRPGQDEGTASAPVRRATPTQRGPGSASAPLPQSSPAPAFSAPIKRAAGGSIGQSVRIPRTAPQVGTSEAPDLLGSSVADLFPPAVARDLGRSLVGSIGSSAAGVMAQAAQQTVINNYDQRDMSDRSDHSQYNEENNFRGPTFTRGASRTQDQRQAIRWITKQQQLDQSRKLR